VNNIESTLQAYQHYKILSLLGEGGSGKTYLAFDSHAKTEVAIKILTLHSISGWKILELFEREAKILQQINHFAIPRYLDFFHSAEEDIFCLVQSIAPGKPLSEWIAKGHQFSEIQLSQIAEQILEILIYLQTFSPPIIHRDIKPQNILLAESGKISLVDFGAVRDAYHLTITGGSTIVGTYGYMAPEQFRGQAVLSTDLYGLGTTLLYLKSSQDPADLPTQKMKIAFRNHMEFSPDFANWLDGLLAPFPEDRYLNAAIALDYLHGKAKIKAPRPKQPLTHLSRTADGIAISIPPIWLDTMRSRITFITISLVAIITAFCTMMFAEAFFSNFLIIVFVFFIFFPLSIAVSCAILFLSGVTILSLYRYCIEVLCHHKIIIDNQNIFCKTEIAGNIITERIMSAKDVQLKWSNGGMEFSLSSPYSKQYRNRIYSFGHFLDRPEQLWLMDEINQHLKFYADKAD
jgi:eukaryotic-like serine/threonine-protein kinase